MKVLFISYYFHPIVNARSIRWLNFCTYLHANGNQVDILTIKPSPKFGPYVEGSEKLIPKELNVIRTHPGLLHHLLLKAQASTKNTNNTHLKQNSKNKSTIFKKTVYLLWSKIVQPILIPDHFIDWVPIAIYNGMKLCRKNKYDVIITSSNPVSAHIVGFFLKGLYPNTVWLAEYGDPWSFYSYPPRSRLSDKIHKIIESTILRKVNYIVATTLETCDGFSHSFPWLTSKQVISIPQGTDTNVIEEIDTDLLEKFTIGYIGRFDPIRSPKALFEAFSILIDQGVYFEFVMAGPLQQNYAKIAEELDLKSQVKFLGHKPHKEALKIAKSCHILLYYGNISTYQLPSKLWEYLALRRPILCIVQTSDDIGANIVKEYKRGLVCKCSPDSIADAIITLQNNFTHGNLEENYNLDYLPEVDWRTRAAKLNQLLQSCCSNGR